MKTSRDFLTAREIIRGFAISPEALRFAMIDQAQIRGLPVHVAEEFAAMVKIHERWLDNLQLGLRLQLRFDEAPSFWYAEVDNFLKVYVCGKCGCTIPGRPHPDFECRESVVSRVMEL